LLDLTCRRWGCDPRQALQLLGGLAVLRVGDGLVLGPAPVVVGDLPAQVIVTVLRSASTSTRRPITDGSTE